MEFFAEIKNQNIDSDNLKETLSIARLPELCDSIDKVLQDNKSDGKIYCLWGEFDINREELDHGIRFSLPHCPNALAWTITCDEDSDGILIHCTIAKKQHDEDFIESIEQFVADWQIEEQVSN